jgi:hypothetical protein
VEFFSNFENKFLCWFFVVAVTWTKGNDGGKIINKNGRPLRDEQFAGKCGGIHQRRK